MMRLACLVADPRDPFADTLLLLLEEHFGHAVAMPSVGEAPPAALLLLDLDYTGGADGAAAEKIIGFTREKKKNYPFPVLSRPFRTEELVSLLSDGGEQKSPLLASPDCRTVTVRGEVISLTEREAALFALLTAAGGRAVSREELCRTLFPNAEDAGSALSVYIHYLRKKLERNGKRVIRSHRGGGYSLALD